MNNEEYSSNSKLIMTNTIMLYMRQILILLVSLYTARIVLNVLGEDDYGIYNVVAGFVTMFNVVSGAFSGSIARYMSYSIGKNDIKKVEDILSTSVLLQMLVGAILMVMIIVFGFLYIDHVMVLGDDRIFAAKITLILSAFSFFMNLLSIPYNSMIIAFEKMKAFAYIGLVDALLKLLIAYAIKYIMFDKLIVYSMFIVADAIIVRILYVVYCKKNIKNISFHFLFEKNLLKELFSFTGWMFFANGAYVIKSQGYNMILNGFCGPAINTARAIAIQVNAGVYGFSTNFMQAVQPQITKLASVEKKTEMNVLCYRTAKLAWFLMLMLCAPIIRNVGFILKVWLGKVPRYTEIFVIFVLVESMFTSLSEPFRYGVVADGRIKYYTVFRSILDIGSIAVMYCGLYYGFSPVCAYVVSLVTQIFILCVIIWQSNKLNDVKIIELVQNVIKPICVVSLITVLEMMLIDFNYNSSIIEFLLESILLEITLFISILICGLTKDEKKYLLNKAKCILKRN